MFKKLFILVLLVCCFQMLFASGREDICDTTIHGKTVNYEYYESGLIVINRNTLVYQPSSNKTLQNQSEMDQYMVIEYAVKTIEQNNNTYLVKGIHDCLIEFDTQTGQLSKVTYYESEVPYRIRRFNYLENGLLDSVYETRGDIETIELKCFYDGEKHEIEAPYLAGNGKDKAGEWFFNVSNVFVYDSAESMRLRYWYFIRSSPGDKKDTEDIEKASKWYFQRKYEFDDFGNVVNVIKVDNHIEEADFYIENTLDEQNNWIERKIYAYRVAPKSLISYPIVETRELSYTTW